MSRAGSAAYAGQTRAEIAEPQSYAQAEAQQALTELLTGMTPFWTDIIRTQEQYNYID